MEPRGDSRREELLALLCAGERTSAEIAQILGMTANGARWHLARVEAEGLVERRTERRGVGKPAHVYRLTETGSLTLSHAYLPVLRGILEVLDESEGPARVEAVLREVGARLADAARRSDREMRPRAEAAVAALRELGAVDMALEEDDGLCIAGSCCPLRALVAEQPLACKAVEAFVARTLGRAALAECDRPSARCRIRVLDATAAH